ncbi:MAG: glycoside hydrolase family 38 C-terminal domain-containing protein [Acutalibacteraceae bacterium]
MKEIHLICNAHVDPIWQWDWQEGASAVLSTFQSAVKLAEKHDYIFCHNEVNVYKYVEEYAPELFSKIQQLVKQGKWHIMGGWYLQPDCNMPSGESFVRQITEAKRYFLEKFGVYPTTAINFDPFGHTVGLVQIMKKCGQDSYIFTRPHSNQLDLPDDLFIWEGLDGSKIKALRAHSYNSPLGKSRESIESRVKDDDSEICLILWGVGNHGGGPSDKDLTDITDLIEASKDKYIHSTPENFFKKVSPTKVFNKSLRISMPGCYTSMYRIKKKHALLENELFFTEKILSAAYNKGLLKKYPEEKIHEITEDLLNAEFHDVLPGTSVQCGEDNGLMLLNHGLLETERLKTSAIFALSSVKEPAKPGEYPIFVFNPHPYELEENIECEFMLQDQNWSDEVCSKLSVFDEKGNEVKYQVIKEESNLNLDWRKRIIFSGKLSPLALNRFSVYVDFEEKKQKEAKQNFVFKNNSKYVEIDSKTGLLKRYSVNGVDYVKNGFQLVSFTDNADPWGMSEEQQKRLGTNEEPFSLSKTPDGVFKNMKSIQVIEDGDICLSVEAFFEKDNSRAVIRYKIYKNNNDVDIDITLYMGDIDKIIKLKIPILVKGTLLGQTAFGTEELFTDARENVAHRFIALDNKNKSLALLNNGTYGSHFENNALYISLVRGVTYCAHPISDRQLIPNNRFTKKIDQGENSFSFRLTVTDTNTLERKSQEFTQKPYAVNLFPIPSSCKEKDFNVALKDNIISLVTMKKADNKNATVFRLLNNSAEEVETEISVNSTILPLHFTKFEVKTVVLENGELREEKELIV